MTFFNDIKYGLRMLAKSPGFTAVAIISLALGIGLNTAIFSLFNTILLKPLPVQNPHELQSLRWSGYISVRTSYCRTFSSRGSPTISNVFSYPTYCEFRDRCSEQAEVFAFVEFFQNVIVARRQARNASGLFVSGNFFRGLGVLPFIGQAITPDHDRLDGEPVTVISYAIWKQLFGSDPDIIGQPLTINNKVYTIIGVLPKDFLGIGTGYRSDFYIPVNPELYRLTFGWSIQVMARLAPDVTEQQLHSHLELLFNQQTEVASLNQSNQPVNIIMEDGRGGPLEPRQAMTGSLPTMMGLAGFILLAACVNLAGLLLARGSARRYELAVRAALGAGRWQMIRQLLIESLLIAVAGAGFGFILTSWSKNIFSSLLWPGTPWKSATILNLQSDIRIFLFTLVVTLATAFFFGLVPALFSSRVSPMICLKDRNSLGTPRLRLGRVLISIQVAISVVLLAGAGLFVRTLVNLYSIETGFNTKNMLVFNLDTSSTDIQNEQNIAFHEQVRAAISALPGVQDVAYSNMLLLSGAMQNSMAQAPGRNDLPVNGIPIMGMSASESYLDTMDIPILLGRGFNATDNETSQNVIIVNRSLASAIFKDDNPVGQILSINGVDNEIIGMCEDITYATLKRSPAPTVFYLSSQNPQWSPRYYQVRTSVAPMTLVPAIRETVARLNERVPMAQIKTLSSQLNESIAQERLFASLSGILGLMALLLTFIGLYGLIAYNISQRTSEIGLRMTLGAQRWDISKPILGEALILAGAGIAIGIPAALAIVRIIRSYLFDVSPYDPAVLISTVIMLLFVALLAAWIPARRAVKIDPMEALRYE